MSDRQWIFFPVPGGTTKEQVRQLLLDRGWQQVATEDGYTYYGCLVDGLPMWLCRCEDVSGLFSWTV